ncbi:hypothetical protein [Flavobacterium sp.]|nr:hypothetical protein [Flavobacterium sp.]
MTTQDPYVLYFESSLNEGNLNPNYIEDLFDEDGPFGEADCAGL